MSTENAMSATPVHAIVMPIGIPEGARIERNGKYLRVANAHGHPIAGVRGRIPYHRYVLFESLGRPQATPCEYCGYVLPWTSTIGNASYYVVNADHIDADTLNNDPANLAASCWWCNANRSWAESHCVFWRQWRRWMKDVPPAVRPNLIVIARECGIEA